VVLQSPPLPVRCVGMARQIFRGIVPTGRAPNRLESFKLVTHYGENDEKFGFELFSNFISVNSSQISL